MLSFKINTFREVYKLPYNIEIIYFFIYFMIYICIFRNKMEDQPDQFTVLMTAIQQLATSQQNLVNALGTGGNTPNTNNPKISVKIPSYKGEPKENIVAWLLRVQTVFKAQGITND